jgi:hypothetical protein
MGRQAEGARLGILVVSFSTPMPEDEDLSVKQSSQFSVRAKPERTRTRLWERTVVLAVVFLFRLNLPLVSGPWVYLTLVEGARTGQRYYHLNSMIQVHTHPCCNLQGHGTSESHRFACRKEIGIHMTQIYRCCQFGQHSHGVNWPNGDC